MSKAFIDRNQRQNTQGNNTDTSQKKIDPVAQLKWLNNLPVDHGFGIFNDSQPAQMFSQDEEEPIQGMAEEDLPAGAIAEEEELLQGKAEEEDLQMKSVPAPSAGTQTGMPKEVKSNMESSFGTDFSGVKVHQNSEKASNIGALAYTQGNDVHFASGQYNPGSQKGQQLLGHELAHVVQQRQGRVQPTTQVGSTPVNDNPSLEKEADVMGAKAAQGKKNSIVHNLAQDSIPVSVSQCYTLKDVASQSAKEWDVKEDIRVADNGMTVTGEDVANKTCYAHSSLIEQSNRELSAKKSGVELVEQSSSIEGSAPNGSGKKTLKKVLPKMSFSTSGIGSSQTAWKDCGRMSREVMGETGLDEHPHGVYKDSSGELQETSRDDLPETHRDNILLALGIGTTPAMVTSGTVPTLTEALTAYNAMSTTDKEAFDKKHGLNIFVSPDVGEAFSTHDAKGFNFHWGGVVFKPGSGDNVTLENSYKTGPVQDTAWYFQTYGSTFKSGQTWHEQWDSPSRDTFTTRTSTRSIVGVTNTAGVRLVDKPANWDDNSHYDILDNATEIKKISSNYTKWIKVEVLNGTQIGKTGYIMKHYFSGV